MYDFLLVIAVILVAFLVCMRILLSRRHRKVKRHIDEVVNSSPYRKSEPIPKPMNDFLLRNQEQEVKKQEELSSQVSKYDPNGLYAEQEVQTEQSKIVGIVEPKGFWSRFVISQKLGYIMARMTASQSQKSGFWVNLINAQGMSQGKDQGRGR